MAKIASIVITFRTVGSPVRPAGITHASEAFACLIARGNNADAPIVWIDHDLDYLLLARRALRNLGVSTPVVCLTDEALARGYLGQFATDSAEGLPRLIVIEVRSPLPDGLNLLKWIRARSQFTAVPVLLAMDSPEFDRDKAKELGATAFFIRVLKFNFISELADQIIRDWI
jgi:two-component system, response regulator